MENKIIEKNTVKNYNKKNPSPQELLALINSNYKNIEKIVGLDERKLKFHEAYIFVITRLSELIKELQFIVKIIIFVINLLVWKVFLWNPLNTLLESLVSKFRGLSENYKILILGVIISFFSMIFAQIVGLLIYKKINDALEKTKKK